jgi:hypothetical protein
MVLQRGAELAVAAPEPGEDGVEGGRHVVVRQGQDPVDDPGGPGFAIAHQLLAGKEQPGDDASGIGS